MGEQPPGRTAPRDGGPDLQTLVDEVEWRLSDVAVGDVVVVWPNGDVTTHPSAPGPRRVGKTIELPLVALGRGRIPPSRAYIVGRLERWFRALRQ